MSIVEAYEKVIEEQRKKFQNSSEVQKFQSYLDEMSKLGFVRKQEYTLPPLDTAGQQLFDCHREKNPGASNPNWLPDMDLNHDKQIQNLLCYRYTIGQAGSRRHASRLDI